MCGGPQGTNLNVGHPLIFKSGPLGNVLACPPGMATTIYHDDEENRRSQAKTRPMGPRLKQALRRCRIGYKASSGLQAPSVPT